MNFVIANQKQASLTLFTRIIRHVLPADRQCSWAARFSLCKHILRLDWFNVVSVTVDIAAL